MKITDKIIVSFVLVIALYNVFVVGSVVLATEPGTPSTTKCEIEPTESGAIPDTFPVGKCLITPGQKSYVPEPEKAESADGATGGASDAAVQKPVGVAVLLLNAIDLLVKLIASLALIVFIAGALLTITSEGKEDRLEKGKSAMLYSIIGLAIAFLSFLIVSFVQSILF